LVTLEDPEALVPLHFAHALAELVVRSEGIPDIGMVVAQQTSAFELGYFGQMLQCSLTVYEYLQTGIRLIGSMTSGSRFWLTSEGERLRFSQYTTGKMGAGRCQGDLYTLVITINMLRRFTNGQWNPEEVCLLSGDEKFLGDRSAFGDTRIITDQPFSSFTIPASLLQQPIPSQPMPKGRDNGDGKAPAQPMPEDFLGSMEHLIETLLAYGHPDVHLTAEAAGMSKRTLQRRLAELGLSYTKVVNQTRMRIAAAHLADTNMSIAEIGVSVGYTDASNFTRAFRCQTGVSPWTYRQSSRQVE
jgi:AraC-like DNA-binding protein